MPMSNKGRHPDLDDQGNLLPDAYVDSRRRDFNRMMRDPARRAVFMQNLARWQSRLPQDVQQFVQRQTYAAGSDAYTGYQAYRQTIEAAGQSWHGGEVTSEDVARMTPAEYDRVFDETGRPREGYTFRPTSRDVVIDDSMDNATRREFGNRGGR